MKEILARGIAFHLLFQYTIWCEAKQQRLNNSVGLPACNGDTCQFTSDSLYHLQEIIRSNRIIVLDADIFSIDWENNFINIESVSNLTIIGHENGTLIQCSPQSSFGFYISNATGVTFTGLRLESCGANAVFEVTFCNMTLCPPSCADNVTINSTFYVEESSNITLSNVHIRNSPTFAVTAGNILSNAKVESSEIDLIIINSTISHCQQGSLMLNRTKSLLIDTLIGNSTIGIMSEWTDLKIKNIVVVVQCKTSMLINGNLTVNGVLTMNQSSINVTQQELFIYSSKVTFIGSQSTIESNYGKFMGTGVILHIEGNSTVLFERFNFTTPSSAMVLVGSSLEMKDNSTLKFTDNTASNGASVFTVLASNVTMSNETSLQITQNKVRGGWILMFAFHSNWVSYNGAMINISENFASVGGRIAAFNTSQLFVFDNASISLWSNRAIKSSTVGHIFRGKFRFYDRSSFIISHNQAIDNSVVLNVLGNISSNDSNVNIAVGNNSVAKGSIIIALHRSMKFERLDISYYDALLQEYNYEKETFFGGITNLLDNSYTFCYNRTNPFISVPLIPMPFFDNDNGHTIERQKFLPHSTLRLSSLSFQGNFLRKRSIGLASTPSTTVVSAGKFIFSENFCRESSLMFLNKARATLREVQFSHNEIKRQGIGLESRASTIAVSYAGKLLFSENLCRNASHVMLVKNSRITQSEWSFVKFTHNLIYRDSSILLTVGGFWRMATDSEISVTANIANGGFSLLFFSTTVTLNGLVRVLNNSVNDFGALNLFKSKISFKGSLEVIGNRAESGAVTADSSKLIFTNTATFSDNWAANGGAMTLISSVMYISPRATVTYLRNQARGFGGAIYISKPRQTYVCAAETTTRASCAIRVLSDGSTASCDLFLLTFESNRAGVAGNAIFGDRTSACIPSDRDDFCSNCPVPDISDIFQYSGVNHSSDLSSFTSDPTRVCFCDKGIPNCYNTSHRTEVHPGELFIISLAIVGYGLGTVPGSVIARGNSGKGNISFLGSELEYSQEVRGTVCQDVRYSIVSERENEWIALAVDTKSFLMSPKKVNAVVEFQQTIDLDNIFHILRSPYDSIFETFFHIPVFVRVELLPCPVGFQSVGGKCICHQVLLKNNINRCSIFNGTAVILIPAPYWIGLPNNANSTILVHPHCPFDYCQSEDLNITVDSPNSQCQYQRSGVLCGSCSKGLSMILGSSECRKCSNNYFLSIGAFILMGVALVIILTLLNMTVSVGSLNGLIIFANILQANRATLLPPTTSNFNAFLSGFIAWLNLDLGIPMCFFDGLTTYIKTWLQFVFPVYILALVGAMITTSNYSTRVTRLLGTNAVSVLATLVLLSYAKILRVLITAFSLTMLTGSQGHHSVVWLVDGNIKYFEAKHAVLFFIALLVLLLLVVPYTITLTAAPWIQKSRFNQVSSLYNRFKPLFDAYMGPYKDKYRYWTGMLLLARVVLIVLFSSIANTNTVAGPQLNLFLLTLSSCALLCLTAILKPYKNTLLNGLEIFHLTILFLLSSSNLYVSRIGTDTGPQTYIYTVLVGICFFVFLGIVVGHIWSRKWKFWTKNNKPKPPEGEEEELPPQWRRAQVRAEDEDEEREVVMMSTAVATASDGGNNDLGYRESVVELTNFD